MQYSLGSNTISVFCEYRKPGDLTVASFVWEHEQPRDAYTLDLGEVSKLRLDSHIPVSPTSLITDNKYPEDLDLVEELFGEELANAMESCQRIGICALQIDLDLDQRLSIADLQLYSIKTPDPLRTACQQMIASNEFVVEELPNDASDAGDLPPAA